MTQSPLLLSRTGTVNSRAPFRGAHGGFVDQLFMLDHAAKVARRSTLTEKVRAHSFSASSFEMPPRPLQAAPSPSDSDELSGDDDGLVWQDGIDWEHYAPTRGLNPSLCVRTRILISMAAARMVTQQQRRDCWTAVGDFPLNEKRVLDAMGAEEVGPRRSSRHAVRSAAEQVRDLAFASDTSDGGLLRKVQKIAEAALCTSQIEAIGLSARVNKPKGKQRAANNTTQQG